jgi:hypothetical protein
MGFPVVALHLFAGLAQIKKKETRKRGDSWANEIEGGLSVSV